MDSRPSRVAFPALLLAAVLLRAFLLGATPFGQTVAHRLERLNDDPAHLNYVRYLAEHHAFPVQTHHSREPGDFEYYQPPLYYLVCAPLYACRLVPSLARSPWACRGATSEGGSSCRRWRRSRSYSSRRCSRSREGGRGASGSPESTYAWSRRTCTRSSHSREGGPHHFRAARIRFSSASAAMCPNAGHCGPATTRVNRLSASAGRPLTRCQWPTP